MEQIAAKRQILHEQSFSRKTAMLQIKQFKNIYVISRSHYVPWKSKSMKELSGQSHDN